MSWYIHWDSSFDLARGGIELSFRKPDDMNQLLVRTEATELVDRIVNKIATPLASSRYHIVGTRGFGKSTILNYFAFRLFDELRTKKILPVYSSLLGFATDEKDLEFVFFRSLLEALFDLPSDLQRFQLETDFQADSKQLMQANAEYKKQLKDFGQVSSGYVTNAFKNQLDHLKKSFPKIVLLIDGMDKQNTQIVLKFLRNTQEHLSNLITKYGLIFIDAADPDWREVLGTKEFGGIRGVLVNLRGWTCDEVHALIQNRLARIGIYQMPFDRKGLEAVVEDFQGNPREILQYCTTLLHYAATEKIATIGPGLARKVVWNDASKDKFFNFVIGDSEARYAFEKLRTVYDNRQMINIMLAAYAQRMQHLSINLDYEARSSVGITLTDNDYKRYIDILLTRGCLKIKTQNYVELDGDLKSLFDFVDMELKESLVALPVVLGARESKVAEAVQPTKEETSLKEEIRKIFEHHPHKWMDYKQCKEMLFENPRTRDKLKERFKEDYDSKITSTMPLFVNELLTNAYLMRDEETSEYRWRPSLIDNETADFFKSKKILDLIESAKKAASDGQMANLASFCTKLILDLAEKLNGFLGGRINTGSMFDIIDFLRNMGVEVTKPVALNLFVQTLKEPILNIDEANVCLQTAVLYARRLFAKVLEFQRFEPTNKEIIDQLNRCKTGNSKDKEREYFNRNMLPLLTQHYGKLLECMDTIKIGKGILKKVPPELDILLKNRQIIPAELYRCPVCGKGTASAVSKEEIEVNFCMEDKVALDHVGSAFLLSIEAYQAWTVWMEEYARSIFEKFPFRYIETGIMLKSKDMNAIASPEEVDMVIVRNGKSIAVECMEKVATNEKKNDVIDLLRKMQGLALFDKIILVYRQVEDPRAFNAETKKNSKVLYPILVGNPKEFRSSLLQALQSIEATACG